jgi:hypothetical protein
MIRILNDFLMFACDGVSDWHRARGSHAAHLNPIAGSSLNIGGHRTARIERDLERRDAGLGHETVSRLQSDDAAMTSAASDGGFVKDDLPPHSLKLRASPLRGRRSFRTNRHCGSCIALQAWGCLGLTAPPCRQSP